MTLTSLALSMAVNALVTGLIVFKILKVILEVQVKTTSTVTSSVERTLGSTGGNKFRHVIFVIIESGMVLFAIHLVHAVLLILANQEVLSYNSWNGLYLVIGTHQMLNVIIKSVHFYFWFIDNTAFTWLGHRTNNNFGAGLNEIVLRRPRIFKGSCRKYLF